MLTTPAELPTAPAWQAALALAPAAVAALGALATRAAGRADADAAWRRARAISLALPLLALASLAAALVAGPAQAWGLRSDPVGAVVALLVAFIGWVIVRYSRPYLAGERGEAGYVGWLLAALASVLVVAATNHLLVLALAWLATGIALQKLLVFFSDRPAALLAAHKKFLLGRVADASMLAACALLAWSTGTLRIDALAAGAAAPGAPAAATQVAIVLVALAALLRCAQLPFHGWLIQVMEAPTPVSALLHAGVVNLGGFVLIRLAPLVSDVPAASGLLVVAGTVTAVVAALVMATRISIKVSLAWSTCAQMGFMLMQCGLGLWEMALLHLVAHSLYKAHAFLGAGGTVRQLLVRRLGGDAPAPSVGRQLAGAAGALGVTALAAWAFGLGAGTPPALWVMAGIVALALSPLVSPVDRAPVAGAVGAWARATAAAFALACVYFALHALLAGRVAPASAVPAAAWWLVPALAFVVLFGLQCALTARPQGRLADGLYPWFYGGLFLDERLSRVLLRRWPAPRPQATACHAALPDLA